VEYRWFIEFSILTSSNHLLIPPSSLDWHCTITVILPWSKLFILHWVTLISLEVIIIIIIIIIIIMSRAHSTDSFNPYCVVALINDKSARSSPNDSPRTSPTTGRRRSTRWSSFDNDDNTVHQTELAKMIGGTAYWNDQFELWVDLHQIDLAQYDLTLTHWSLVNWKNHFHCSFQNYIILVCTSACDGLTSLHRYTGTHCDIIQRILPWPFTTYKINKSIDTSAYWFVQALALFCVRSSALPSIHYIVTRIILALIHLLKTSRHIK